MDSTEHENGLDIPGEEAASGSQDTTSARRDFLKTTGAAAVVAAAGGLVRPSQAHAAARQGGQLPPIGAEIPCSCLALNVPLRVETGVVNLDFRGGIKVRVEVNPNDPYKSVRLKVIGHRVEADSPVLGKVTIEQSDIDVTPESLLTLVSNYPPKYEQVMVLSFTLTFEGPPAATLRSVLGVVPRQTEPTVLTTKDPAVLVATLQQFPPRGDLYRLQNPVDLVLPDNPDVVVAQIQKFPVKVGGL